MDAVSGSRPSLNGPFITLDTWLADGRLQHAPCIDDVRALPPDAEDSDFGDGPRGPRLLILGNLADDGLPRSWTIRTRSRTNHHTRVVTVILDVVTDPLPTMRRVPAQDRPLSLLVVADPRRGSFFSTDPYEIRIFSSKRLCLARLKLTMMAPTPS